MLTTKPTCFSYDSTATFKYFSSAVLFAETVNMKIRRWLIVFAPSVKQCRNTFLQTHSKRFLLCSNYFSKPSMYWKLFHSHHTIICGVKGANLWYWCIRETNLKYLAHFIKYTACPNENWRPANTRQNKCFEETTGSMNNITREVNCSVAVLGYLHMNLTRSEKQCSIAATLLNSTAICISRSLIVINPVTPMTIGMIFAFIFHILCKCICRSLNLRISSASFCIRL